MKVCIVTDEISADPETAIELGVGWGVKDFELRGYYYDRVPEISNHQRQRLHETLDQYDARVVAVSPGLFKFPFTRPYSESIPLPWLDRIFYDEWENSKRRIEEHLKVLLPKTIDFAHEFGAKSMVSFGFSRGGLPAGDPPDELYDYLYQAAEVARAGDLQLVIETEVGFWADTGERTASIIRRISHPNLRINWDPGNSFLEGDIPFPDGYQHVRGLVGHVHFKDARRMPDGGSELVAEGQIDWAGQIRALYEDGYDGYVSIESHLRPKVAEAIFALNRLRNLIEAAESPLQ